MSRVVSVQVPHAGRRLFYDVRLPKGISSPASPKVRHALERMKQKITAKPGCLIVLFRGRGGAFKAIQRCEHRSIKSGSAFARKAAARLKGPNKKVCRKGGAAPKAKRGQFAPCRRGKKRR